MMIIRGGLIGEWNYELRIRFEVNLVELRILQLRENKIINMRLLFLLIFSITTQYGFGQMTSHDISKKANKYFDAMEYDSAAYYYKKIIYKDEWSSWILERLGDAYSKLEEFDEAEYYYKESLVDTICNISDVPTGWCTFVNENNRSSQKLTDLYISNRRYSEALEILRMEKRDFVDGKYTGGGVFAMENKGVNYDFSQCFYGVGELDSAIIYLTPSMFIDSYFYSFDTLAYKDVNDFYYELLRKRYSKEFLKEELMSAIENLHYEEKLEKGVCSLFKKEIIISQTTYFDFLGARIFFLDDRSSTSKRSEKNLYKRTLRTRIVREITQMGIYQKIMYEDF